MLKVTVVAFAVVVTHVVIDVSVAMMVVGVVVVVAVVVGVVIDAFFAKYSSFEFRSGRAPFRQMAHPAIAHPFAGAEKSQTKTLNGLNGVQETKKQKQMSFYQKYFILEILVARDRSRFHQSGLNKLFQKFHISSKRRWLMLTYKIHVLLSSRSSYLLKADRATCPTYL